MLSMYNLYCESYQIHTKCQCEILQDRSYACQTNAQHWYFPCQHYVSTTLGKYRLALQYKYYFSHMTPQLWVPHHLVVQILTVFAYSVSKLWGPTHHPISWCLLKYWTKMIIVTGTAGQVYHHPPMCMLAMAGFNLQVLCMS